MILCGKLFNCSDNSFISDGANRYGARATGATLGIKSIWNSTSQAGGRPGNSSGNTSGKSRTIAFEHEISVNRLCIPISFLLILNWGQSLLKCLGAPLKTTISLRSCPIALLSISNICVTSTPAIASKMPYFVALVALLGARAIVVKMALGALGQRSPIRLPFACPHIVDLGDILPLEGLLLVTMVVSE
ncbi:hypothetical protein Tco_0033217 [Tanacetum coccineum]